MHKLLKAFAIVLCVVALVGGSIAGTVAYLTMVTAPVENTFTAGNINITLTQANITTEKIIPGATYSKKPLVTVKSGSEACYLFVKLDGVINGTVTPVATEGEEQKVDNVLKFSDYLTYTMGDGWTALEGVDGVYYREVGTANADATFYVLATEDSLTAVSTCTKADYDKLDGKNITLSITAYAVQQAGFDTAADAWDLAKTLGTT